MAEAQVTLTLESLYDLVRREKNREEIQKLSDSFYHDVVAYLQEKKVMMATAEQGLRIFSEMEREKALLQFNHIKRLIRELYEVRERKIINMALNKSKDETILINLALLLPEEKSFYNELVVLFSRFRQGVVLNLVKNLRAPEVKNSLFDTSYTAPKQEVYLTAQQNTLISNSPSSELSTSTDFQSSSVSSEVSDADQDAQITMVRFLKPVPRFVGESMESYGPFEEDNLANLPSKIATILIKKGRAEEIKEG